MSKQANPDTKLHVTSAKILELMDYVIANRLNGITNQIGFCKAIGYPSQNFPRIKKGDYRFSLDDIQSIIDCFAVDANWIFGRSSEMFLMDDTNPKLDGLSTLKLAANKIAVEFNELEKILKQVDQIKKPKTRNK